MIKHPALSFDVGLWSETLKPSIAPNRPAVFLDRDGIVVEEVHFLKRARDVHLCDDVAEAIAEANAAQIPVIIATNQSGIARGHFGWEEFAEVQAEILSQLGAVGAEIDAVFACAYHEEGIAPFDVPNHEWRKPAPGMFHHASNVLTVDLSRSFVVGDRVTDLEAGRNAGLRGGILALSGYGRQNVDALAERRQAWASTGFMTTIEARPAEAIRIALRCMTEETMLSPPPSSYSKVMNS